MITSSARRSRRAWEIINRYRLMVGSGRANLLEEFAQHAPGIKG